MDDTDKGEILKGSITTGIEIKALGEILRYEIALNDIIDCKRTLDSLLYKVAAPKDTIILYRIDKLYALAID